MRAQPHARAVPARNSSVTDESENRRASRPLPLELSDEPLDIQAIILGTLSANASEGASRPPPAGPAVVWRGKVRSDRGSRDGYWVQLLADGTGQCSCADYYFRGVLRRDAAYSCKHIRRARADQS